VSTPHNPEDAPFLLDTNVVSEWAKPTPDPGVIAWTHSVDEDRVSLSVITLAEIRSGVERLPQSRRRSRLQEWLEVELPRRFDKRVLAVDEAVAHAWGRIVAEAYGSGHPISIMDGFLAATAKVHHLILATRNVAHFEHIDLPTFNPWTA
jgi:toxin FitB